MPQFKLRYFLTLAVFFIAQKVYSQNKLEDIVVTATRYEENTQNIPSSITVITKEEIQASQASTVNEAIMNIAGVPGRRSLSGGNEYSLDLLGFGDTAQSNTVIVIDGIPLKEGDTSETRLSGIPIDQIERIEIQRGSSSVLYGEGATSGVINIITKAGSKDFSPAQSVNFLTGIGSYNTQEYKGNAYYSADGFKTSLSVSDVSTDGYRTNSSSKNLSGAFNMIYKFDNFIAGMNVSSDDVNARLPGALTLQQFSQNPKQIQSPYSDGSTHLGDYVTSNTKRYGTFLESEISGVNVRVDVGQRYRDVNFYSYRYIPNSLATRNNFVGIVLKKSFDYENFKNTTTVGFEKNYWFQDRNNTFGNILIDSGSIADYVKNDLYLKDYGTTISAGLRKEKFNKNVNWNDQGTGYTATGISTFQQQDNLTGWEFGISKELFNNNNVYTRFSRGYRLPNGDEASNTLVNLGGYYSGVIGLQPQTSTLQEIGWKMRLSSGGKVGLRIYKMQLNNEIAFAPITSDGFPYNLNLDPTQRQGVDFEFSNKITKNINLLTFVGYKQATFVDGQYVGNSVPLAPAYTGSIRLDWKFQPNQKIGTTVNIVSDQYVAGDFGNSYDKMPSYSTVDLSYSYTYQNIEFSGLVKNLLDKQYYSYATLGYDSSYNPYVGVYPDLGRTLMGRIKVKF